MGKFFKSDRADRWLDDAGELHREDGPAYIEYTDSSHTVIAKTSWYRHGKNHRIDGPAVQYHGVGKMDIWYVDDKIHRWDGPAIVTRSPTPTGDNVRENWAFYGNKITPTLIEKFEEMGIDYQNLSEDDKTIITLILGKKS